METLSPSVDYYLMPRQDSLSNNILDFGSFNKTSGAFENTILYNFGINNTISDSSFTRGIHQTQGTIDLEAGTNSIRVNWNSTTGTDSLWMMETNLSECIGDTSKLIVVRVQASTAQFASATLCAGDNLYVNFTGTSPWSLHIHIMATPQRKIILHKILIL